ncbi:unnamed protein product, partial [Leptidea sinapis]
MKVKDKEKIDYLLYIETHPPALAVYMDVASSSSLQLENVKKASVLRKLEPFNLGNNNWDAYIRRLNQFITLNEIKRELKVATLVTVVGAECYEFMCDLTAPDAPASKTYKGKCRFKRDTCDNCGEKGHLKAVCDKNKSEYIKGVKPKKGQFFFNDSDSEGEDYNFYNLVINSEDFYHKYFSNIPLKEKILCLKSYTGDVIETLGYIIVNVSCGKNHAKLNLYVIEKGGPPLMGRTWIKQLKLAMVECHNLTESDSIATSLRSDFPEVFAEGLVVLCGFPSTAVFADDICVTGKDRASYLNNLRAVLQRLKENGILSPTSVTKLISK